MDTILIVLALVLVVVLVGAYLLNRVPKLQNLTTLFNNVRLLDPMITAFTLRYDEETGKYVNVSIDENGEVRSRRENRPIDKLGSYIINQDHGTVEDLANGFKISGFETSTFTCPSGYSGPTCQLNKLCEPIVDDGRLKPLTYTQFNDLYVNQSINPTIVTRGKRDAPIEAVHPRIRIQCLTNGEYELQACPDNRLLDKNLSCRPYDLCQDRLSGYKHNNQISDTDPPLPSNQYYICENGASVKTTCLDGTKFSMSANGCITESVCFGKGSITLPRDEKSYIQCKNDVGVVVNCTNGVTVNASGDRVCVSKACEPQTLSFSDSVISYVYGQVVCVNNRPELKICDNAPKPRKYEYNWAEPFNYTIDNWPTEILNTKSGICETPTDSIIVGPVSLAWSSAMYQSHPYDLRTEQFVCEPNSTKYRWDYKNGTTVPSTDMFVDTGAPCQSQALTATPWSPNVDLVRYPEIDETKPFTRPPLLIGEPMNALIDSWPVYSSRDRKYRVSLVDLSSDGSISLSAYESDIPPLGFAISKSRGDGFAELIGFGVPKDPESCRWFTIASGKFEPIRASNKPVKRIVYKPESSIPLTQVGSYVIAWGKLDTSLSVLLSDVGGTLYSLSSKGITKRGTTFPLVKPIPTIITVGKADVNAVVEVAFSKSFSIKINTTRFKNIPLEYAPAP